MSSLGSVGPTHTSSWRSLSLSAGVASSNRPKPLLSRSLPSSLFPWCSAPALCPALGQLAFRWASWWSLHPHVPPAPLVHTAASHRSALNFQWCLGSWPIPLPQAIQSLFSLASGSSSPASSRPGSTPSKPVRLRPGQSVAAWARFFFARTSGSSRWSSCAMRRCVP